MRAFTYKQYGSPDVLTEVSLPKPTPKEHEVLIRVHATTVSSGDWRARSMQMPRGMGLAGRLFFGITGPRKKVLGTEFAGVVEAVGAKVTRYAPGDAVIGFPGADFGAHAEYIVLPEDGKLVMKPESLSFEAATALPFGGTAAYDFLVNKAGIKADEEVLINGASGAVGSASVQIAKHLGARVTAVTSGRNAAMVRALGADAVIDYTTRDFTREGARYDVVVDTVGTAPFHRARHALRPTGRMVMVTGKASDMIFGALKALFYRRKFVSGVASEDRAILQAVVDLAETGDLQPVIDRCFDFADMRAAHRHVDSGRKKGAVVVNVTPARRGEGSGHAVQLGAA
ncbi:NAD(P)-dependent alcohol dehydrogenase [Gymnodinialimonas ceratoperidinii]|uniref:NAD(P)-dependent alcohol dehydrogenase n=1 Tax=Gymnodinialimonas ceratoperidinii TaxID=2856823 RepID=A0A8F6TSY7_9RHOB|nr:NAD(P)-dependent alcohol dehydrogenase [Gymnodinialimonas ceratoperidinii]QXT38382.1 NAD(P)-dependent alcohol dehydrogenase [Gymnodinialimonas ceratoperidinii]